MIRPTLFSILVLTALPVAATNVPPHKPQVPPTQTQVQNQHQHQKQSQRQTQSQTSNSSSNSNATGGNATATGGSSSSTSEGGAGGNASSTSAGGQGGSGGEGGRGGNASTGNVNVISLPSLSFPMSGSCSGPAVGIYGGATGYGQGGYIGGQIILPLTQWDCSARSRVAQDISNYQSLKAAGLNPDIKAFPSLIPFIAPIPVTPFTAPSVQAPIGTPQVIEAPLPAGVSVPVSKPIRGL